jgi:pimeloyl-ACP methyl ester carboxylesterase
MTDRPNRWRRLAAKLARHASRALPDAQSPWADAMRRELDYIDGDPGAMRWAIGCILASYRLRLTHWLRFSVRTAWRYVGTSCVLMLLIVVSLQGPASGQTDPVRPTFAETACTLPNLSPDVRPRLRCGTVSVPRDYAAPGAGQFKLAVVIVGSPRQPPLPDPVVYINGGPGSPLTIYADHQARTPYAANRDLILVDQRGTGRSEPSLCSDLNGRLVDANIAVATTMTSEAFAKRQALHAACRNEAIGQGLDPADFGTRVTVEDFERVRQALGIERWNVYGESYGTTVAMTLLALHPKRVRSAVLDSVYPPDPIPKRSTLVAGALDAFFASCAQDTACATSYPDLAGTYREALDRLGQAPLIVTVPPRMHRPDDRVQLTASSFEALVSNLIYYPSAYPGLPRLIQAVHDGDSQGLAAAFAPVFGMAMTQNIATFTAVECRDRPHLRDPLPASDSKLDRMQGQGLCNRWSDLGPPPLIPIDTAVPSLVLAGQFDPVAGPALSRHVAELIGKNARWIELPLIGHNVKEFSPCGARIAADFIDHPLEVPDTSCAARVAAIRFLPKYQNP